MKWNDRIGRRLKLHDLHIFLTVAEMGSMGKAAEQLSVSQPSVSKAIADMEHTIGVPLLVRMPQGVQTTPYGRALIKRGMGAFDELRRGIKDIEFLADPTAGEVRVGCPEAIASGLLLAVLRRFCEQHPRVVVNVHAANNMSQEYRLVRDRKVDFLLGGVAKPLGEQDLDVEVLYEDRPFIVSGPKNPWANRRKIELAELVDEPWALSREGIFSSLLAGAFQSKGLAFPRKGVRSYSVYERIGLLATDAFIAAESGSVLRFNMPRFSLKVLPVDLATGFFQVGIVTLKNRTVSPVVQTFLDCVRKVASLLAHETISPPLLIARG
jgi:DNA-binding transcriptional LysR family regulator